MRSLHINSRMITIIFFLMVSMSVFGGRDNGRFRTFKKAMAAAENKDFETAMALYSEILSQNPGHVDALTQLGVCMVTANQSLDSALVLFNKALNIIPREDRFSPFGFELQRTIARTHNLNAHPKKALAILKTLKDSVENTQLKNELRTEILQTRNAAVLLKNPVPLKITNLGDQFNSGFDDHSPLVSLTGNRIFFTSRRPAGRDKELSDGQYSEKVFFAEHNGYEWEQPRPMGRFFSRSEHKSILSLSPDGNRIFLFKNDREGKSIYVSNYRNDEWQEPEKLPHPINSEWAETHASLSPDQSTLFFTSDRPGGYGGLDIYMVKLNEYGKWGEPVNMGPEINSEKDEETPMLHPDGRTLYFASEGHSSMGRFDVFFSQLEEDGSWAEPVNMGHPINTPDDDFFFVPTLDKSQAYYASYRFKENVGRSDIYKVEFDSLYNGSLAVIEGTIQNSKNLPAEHIRILVSRDSDNKRVGDYRPNPETGRYLLFLEAGESYTIKEMSPEKEEEEQVINVPEQLAFDNSEQVLMVQDPRMLPPLKPEQESFGVDTRKLAENNQKSAMERINDQERDTTYTIQLIALKHYPKVGLWFFNGLNLETVKAMEGRDGYLRYVAGHFDSREEAIRYRSKIQREGHFADAWIRPWEPLKELSKGQTLLAER
ncbi:tetratricopeptide repeat protein [Marinilabilia rubra]|nr:tetratricopeptide repeat protein [Marinilabilia rubra]